MKTNTKIRNAFERLFDLLRHNVEPTDSFEAGVNVLKSLRVKYKNGTLFVPKKITRKPKRRAAVFAMVEAVSAICPKDTVWGLSENYANGISQRNQMYPALCAARAKFLGIKQEKVTPTERGQAPEEPVREEVYDLHIGDKKAFNGWKLIWTVKGEVRLAVISEKTAKMLIADGMTVEG